MVPKLPINISYIPFRPSNLSIPSSPFTPRPPLSPQLPPKQVSGDLLQREGLIVTTPPPETPLQWVWQCHICRQTYPLAVTRRCLEDGHNFCAGATTVKTTRTSNRKRSARRHRACASEFDYSGWKAWGDWRRAEHEFWKTLEASVISPILPDFRCPDKNGRDCWNNCNYPSECRWGQKYGIQSPNSLSAQVITTSSTTLTSSSGPKTTFEDILGEQPSAREAATVTTAMSEKENFWVSLLTSATRRKSDKDSRLSTVMEVLEADEEAINPTITNDGDNSKKYG